MNTNSNISLTYREHRASSRAVMSSNDVLGPDLEYVGGSSMGWDNFQIAIKHADEVYPLQFVFTVTPEQERVTVSIMGEDRDGELFVLEEKIGLDHWAMDYISRLVVSLIANWTWEASWEYTVVAHFEREIIKPARAARVVLSDS